MRVPTLRQIEAFRSVIETGTVSKAADVLHISQPAASKLIQHLEQDSGFDLFERESGRLTPTKQGMRLYEEIERIFSGVDQIAQAVEMIRREDRGRLKVGVLPGLSGRFMAQVMKRFTDTHGDVFVTVTMNSSHHLHEWLLTRQLDIAIVSPAASAPTLESEGLMCVPLVCIMPVDHLLTAKAVITPADLAGERLISYSAGSLTQREVARAFGQAGVAMTPALEASNAMSICECVAAGVGLSILHPLLVEMVRERVTVRAFEPAVETGFQICSHQGSRNAGLAKAFAAEVRTVARISLGDLRAGRATGLA